ELAREYGLRNADKKDSQGICFIGKVKMVDFLRAHLPDKPGPVYEAESGRYLGKHLGLHLYTIGQGRGVGIASPHKGRGYVVVRKDWERNALIMALEGEDAPGLYEKVCWLNDVSWPGSELKIPGEYGVRPRYRAAAERALVSKDGEWVKVEFEKPQRALTLGQVAVLYDGERVAGAGFIAMVGERKF
ncbi:MAG: hypothetical protein NZL93_04030, partial [Chthoniobacterales bacterium]|nr:hypothetical protein [Chthoniobacterales bacterium]